MSKSDGDVCEKCRFWDFQEELERDGPSGSQEHRTIAYGHCRRYAPAALHESESRKSAPGRMLMRANWPYTEGEDWCGEWKPNV